MKNTKLLNTKNKLLNNFTNARHQNHQMTSTVKNLHDRKTEIKDKNVDLDYQRKDIVGRFLKQAQSIVESDEAGVPLVLIATQKAAGFIESTASEVSRVRISREET